MNTIKTLAELESEWDERRLTIAYSNLSLWAMTCQGKPTLSDLAQLSCFPDAFALYEARVWEASGAALEALKAEKHG